MNSHKMGPDRKDVASSEEICDRVKQERRWLKENDAESAVSGGPVEDLEGIPLPADLHQPTPPARGVVSDVP